MSEPVTRRIGAVARIETVAGILAMVATAVLTRQGLLITGDSAAYLKTGLLFRDDPSRIFSPPTGTDLSIRGLFPPGYPILIALGGGREAARWLAVLAAGVTVFLLVRTVRVASTPVIAAFVGVLVVANRAVLLVMFGFLLSDGLHLMFGVAAAAATVAALRSTEPRRAARFWVLASGLAALAFSTRYAGLGVVAGVAASSALLGRTSSRDRLRWAAVSTAVGVAPLVMWTVIIAGSGDVGHREVGLHPLGRGSFDLFRTFAWVYLPRPVIETLGPERLAVVVAFVVAGLLVWSTRRIWSAASTRPADPSERVTAAFLLIGWGYLATLLATQLLVDRQVGLGGRYAVPWMTMLVAAIGVDVPRRVAASTDPRRSARRWAAAAAAVGLLALPGFVGSLRNPPQAWWNYSQLPESTLVEMLAPIPQGRTVFTNREETVYFRTGRPTSRIPRRLDLYTFEPNRHFERRLREIAREVERGRAVLLVWIDDPWGISIADVRRITGLIVADRNEEGALFVGSERKD